jgi:small subunit ribosomal protein S6
MRRYETTFIIDPDITAEGRLPVFERLKDLVDQFKGELLAVDEWGSRKLAYDIKKKTRGYYVRLDYCGNGDLVNEIERFFRIDDRILKFMSLQLAADVNAATLKAEMAKAEEARRQKEEGAAAPSPPSAAEPQVAEAPLAD